MIDRTLKHYRIIGALGSGGMGEVYLAEDTTLDRKVALKILPTDVASNRNRMDLREPAPEDAIPSRRPQPSRTRAFQDGQLVM